MREEEEIELQNFTIYKNTTTKSKTHSIIMCQRTLHSTCLVKDDIDSFVGRSHT